MNYFELVSKSGTSALPLYVNIFITYYVRGIIIILYYTVDLKWKF